MDTVTVDFASWKREAERIAAMEARIKDLEGALAAEREAIAKMVEAAAWGTSLGAHHVFANLCLLANAIRARSALTGKE